MYCVCNTCIYADVCIVLNLGFRVIFMLFKIQMQGCITSGLCPLSLTNWEEICRLIILNKTKTIINPITEMMFSFFLKHPSRGFNIDLTPSFSLFQCAIIKLFKALNWDTHKLHKSITYLFACLCGTYSWQTYIYLLASTCNRKPVFPDFLIQC